MKRRRARAEESIARLMKKLRITLATAESCTGGLLSHKITNVSGSSEYFIGGIIAYDNKIKEVLLNVPIQVLKRFGAVSKETALAMARGVKTKLVSDIGIAITGIAGPTGGSKIKPVGTVFIAISGKTKKECKRFLFKGDRKTIKLSASSKALDMLKDFLLVEE